MMASRQGKLPDSRRNYTTRRKHFRPRVQTFDERFSRGGAKGWPGKLPRAAIEGARTVYKAARTPWRIAQILYNRHASVSIIQNPFKTMSLGLIGVANCEQLSTGTVHRLKHKE